MIDLKLTETGDLAFENNDFIGIEDPIEAVNQKVYITLSTCLAEFELDQTIGLRPDNLFGRNVVPDYVKQDVREAIEDQIPEIDTLDTIDISMDKANRSMDITISYTTADQAEGDFSNSIKIGGV